MGASDGMVSLLVAEKKGKPAVAVACTGRLTSNVALTMVQTTATRLKITFMNGNAPVQLKLNNTI